MTELVIDSRSPQKVPPPKLKPSSCCFRLVLALDVAHQLSQWLFQLFSQFTGSGRQNEDCGFDAWEILASPLKQLLITGRVNVVATTSLPGFSLAESRSAFIQTCSLRELWPLSDPITCSFVRIPSPNISRPSCQCHVYLFGFYNLN